MNEFVIFILPDGSEKKVKRENMGAFRINNPGSKIKQEDAVDIQLRKQKEQAEKDLSEVVNIDKQGRSLLNQNIPKTSSYYQRLREAEQDLSDAELSIKSKQELANTTKQSVDIISDKYKDPDLFSKELISREAQYLGKGVYLPKIEKEVYKNLTDEQVDVGLNLYNVLSEQYGRNPTQEEWEYQWRQQLYDNELSETVQKVTIESGKNLTEKQREEIVSIEAPKIKGISEERDRVELSMSEVRKVIKQQSDLLESSNEFKYVNNFEKEIKDPLIQYIIGEGQEFFVINDKKIPKDLVDRYNTSLQSVREQQKIISDQYGLYEKQYDSYRKLSDKVLSGETQLDILKRDFDTVAKAANLSKNFVKSSGIGLAEYASVLIAPKARPYFAQLAIEHRKNAAQEKARFLPDIKFDEAFDSVDNFSEFILQEAAIQIPIMASIAVTGGVASAAGLGAMASSAAAATFIGVSSAGSQLGDMDYEEDLANNDKFDFNDINRGDLQKFLVSTGFGLLEGGLSALPTARIFNAAGKSFAQGSKGLVTKGVNNYVNKRVWSGVMEPTFTETYTEGLTQLGQNFITGNPLFEGVGHAMFSGGFFGFAVNSMPTIASLAITNFSDYDKKIEFRKNVFKIAQLKSEFESKYGSGDGSVFLDSKENTPEKTAEYNEQKKIVEDQINTLNKKNDEILIEIDENVRSLSEESFNAYTKATIEQEQIRNEVEKIVDNPDYKQTRQDRINILQERFNKLAELKDKFRNVKDFGNIYSMLENSDPEEYKIITEKAEAAVRKEEGLDSVSELNTEKVEKKRFDIYLDRLVEKDIANTRSLIKIINDKKEKVDLQVFETQEEISEYVKNVRSEITPDEKIDLLEYANGAIIKRKKGKNTIILTKENIKENKRTRSGVHEISHQLFAEALKDVDNNMKKELANNIYTWLSTTNESAFIEMFSGYYEGQTVEGDGKNFIAEEVIVGFMERVAEGKIDLTSRENRGFPQLLGNIVNKGLSKFGKSAKINFQGEKDIIDFLSGIAKSLEKGIIDQESIDAINEKAKERKKRIAETKKSTGEKKSEMLLSQGITPEMTERSDRLQEIYEDEGDNGAWTALEEGLFDTTIEKVINSYLRRRYRSLKTPEAESAKVKEDMISSLKYDPNGIVDLFRTYDVEKGPLGAYVSKYLKIRSNKILKNATKDKAEPSYSDAESQYLTEASVGDFVNEESLDSVEEIEDIDNELLDPKTLLDEKLSEQAIKNVASRIDEVSEKSKTFKDLPDLSEETTAERFGIPVDKVSLKKRFTQNELKSALSNLKEIAEDFIKILPEGAITDPAVRKDLYGTATGLPTNILENFYVKGDRIDTRSGLKVFDLKENITVQDFYNAIGLESDASIPKRVDVRSAEAQTAKGLVNLFGRLVTNTTARQELAKRVGTEQEILNIESGKANLMLSAGRINFELLPKKTKEEFIKSIGFNNELVSIDYEKVDKIRNNVSLARIAQLKAEKINLDENSYEKVIYDDTLKLAIARLGGYVGEHMFIDFHLPYNTDNFGIFPTSAGTLRTAEDVYFYYSDKKDNELNHSVTKKYADTFGAQLKNELLGRVGKYITLNKKTYQLFDRNKKFFNEESDINLPEKIKNIILNRDTDLFFDFGDAYKKISGQKNPGTILNLDLAKKAKKKIKPANYKTIIRNNNLFEELILNPYIEQNVELLFFKFKPYALNKELSDATGLPMLYEKDLVDGQRMYPQFYIKPEIGLTATPADKTKAYFGIRYSPEMTEINSRNLYKDHKTNQLFSSKLLQDRLTNYFKAKKEGTELPKLSEAEIRETYVLKEGETSIYFSRPMALKNKFNKILEQNKGVSAKKIYSDAEAEFANAQRGISKKFGYFVPPTAEDFMGLIYSFLGKGKIGDEQKQFFEEALNLPYKRGVAALESSRQKMADDYFSLRKKYKDVTKKLGKKIPGEEFTHDQAIRVFLWRKNGFDLSKDVSEGGAGIKKRESNKLYRIVANDPRLLEFALGVERIINEPKGYVEPTKTWLVDTIAADMDGSLNKQSRERHLKEFIENSKEIFNKENLNKIQAIYGKVFRESLENSLHRMKTGINREQGKDREVNAVENFINQSTATIMFLNVRSALLQQVSFANFVNWSDNNILAAGAAFANQPQFWSDFSRLFNSDKLKQRRKGLKLDVNQAELANSVAGSKNKLKAAYNYMVKIGFAPTQISDSFAIALGGASFYRNRIKTYLKQGLSESEAESKSLEDFYSIAEETQQSSDPALISKQQAGTFGRFILAFNNVAMQYNRQIKKSFLDIKNKRGDGIRSFEEGAWKTHLSKIIYYGAIQNIAFNSLQSGLFFLLFDDDEEEREAELAKKGIKGDWFSKEGKDDKAFISSKWFRVLNNSINTIIRGTGLVGAGLVALKDTYIEYRKQDEKGFLGETGKIIASLANVSPTLGNKVNNLYQVGNVLKFEKDLIKEQNKGFKDTFPYFQIDNPIYEIAGRSIEASTNIPLNRLRTKVINFGAALDSNNKNYQRIATSMGWSTWNIGIENKDQDRIKAGIKERRKKEGIKKAKETRRKNRLDKKMETAKRLRDIVDN